MYFGRLNNIILNDVGIKYTIKGYIKENPKLIKVSFKRYICVFLYIEPKQAK